MRPALFSFATTILCTIIPIAILRWVMPSTAEIGTLRAQRSELTAAVAALERNGGRVEWRRCGATARLCVRVDRRAPVFGDKSDYFIVAGY